MKMKGDKIIELRKMGLTINQITDKLGCAKSTVSYHINKSGMGGVRNKFISEIPDGVIKNIIELRNEKKTYDEILKIVDISKDKLKKICRIMNANKSSSLFIAKKVNTDEIIEYYMQVKSLRKTSIHFNLSRETIRKRIPNDIVKSMSQNRITITKSESVISWRKRTKIKLIEYKGGKCEICGYNKCYGALHFHHLNSDKKDFDISGKSLSFERLKAEADKCILVCSNCHSELHNSIYNGSTQ